MKRTFGAPSFARLGSGHAGCETSAVRPITPGNVVPGLYSFSAIDFSPFSRKIAPPMACQKIHSPLDHRLLIAHHWTLAPLHFPIRDYWPLITFFSPPALLPRHFFPLDNHHSSLVGVQDRKGLLHLSVLWFPIGLSKIMTSARGGVHEKQGTAQSGLKWAPL
jgi:hypothetical protein